MEPTKPTVSKWLLVTFIAVVVLGAIFFVWYYLMGPGKKAETKTATTTATTTPAATSETSVPGTEDWLTYTNTTYGYSIKYPKDLSYTEEDGTKYMHFYTAAEAAALAECQTREATECNPGHEIYIAVDQNAGTTNADDMTKTLAEIINSRISAHTLTTGATTTTLGGQPAYEGISEIMLTNYNIISKYSSHLYDLTITCGEGATTLAACKTGITAIQNKMITTFQFTP